MKGTISSIVNRQTDIERETMDYQNFVKNKGYSEQEYAVQRANLTNFFSTFNDNEIIVLKSLMYLGRDVYSENLCTSATTKTGIITDYTNILYLKINKVIDKNIQIDQIMSKGLRIGRYFYEGFEKLNKYPL